MSERLHERLGRALLEQRWITATLALLLLATSVLLGAQWERRVNAEQARQVGVQAQILAGSLSGALAFHDDATVREYIEALRASPDVLAAGVYAENGRLVTGFVKQGTDLPRRVESREPEIRGRRLSVIQPVREGNLELGHVYLRSSVEPLSARLSRYLAIGIVLVLAALLIALLGAANAAAVAANRKLQQQIAAREQAESALRQAQKMEALGQLTGGVAHDFNNLLMAASSGLELMDRAKDEERRAKFKSGIREALDRGARITEQLLAFARRRPLQSEVVRLDAHIAKLADLLDHSLRENISVKFAIPQDIWPIEVDSSQFDIAILNLAVNARDAMPKGGEVCISARNRPDLLNGTDAIEITVEDEGSGMTPETLDKAFEPFFTTKDFGRGTGLGLSQVYGFAHAAGGNVSIASEVGKGTRVTMAIPRAGKDVELRVVESAGTPGETLANRTVLLVEDDANLNELVSAMLEESGADVVRASSGAEGVALLGERPVDIVLSDMVMPGEIDGLGLARRVRQLRPDVPIVLMTGYSDAVDSASAEGFRVLRKPFTESSLVTAFERALRRQES